MARIQGLNTLLAYLKAVKEDPTSELFNRGYWSSLNEYPIFFSLIAQFKPANVVECGTCNGASALVYAVALHLSEVDGKVYTFDIVNRGWLDANTNFADRVVHHLGSFSEIAAPVIETLNDKPLLYFIDGDHSYEGCKADVEAIKPFLKAGDVIVFHDWHHGPVAESTLDAFKGLNFRQQWVVPSKQGIGVFVYGDN